MPEIIINYGIIIAFLITLLAHFFIKINYAIYKRKPNQAGITGKKIAEYILEKNGLEKVNIIEVGGELTDHYNPSNKTVSLSSSIYRGTSIASLAVAAHECGHALQDKDNYMFLRFRCALVPLVNFSSYAGYIAITIGLLANLLNIFWIGIILELVILLFQFITLPVEINASRRALKELKKHDLIIKKEISGSRTMLIAAASTYLASVAASLLQILRLILIMRSRRTRK